MNNGLSQNNVRCILQDREGFMWFGTEDGLNMYNGYEFTVFRHDPNKPESISANNILSILEDKEGELWIGTRGGGLCRFKRSTQTFENFRHDPQKKNSLSNNEVFDIYEDNDGVLWIGTDGGGLNAFDRLSKSFKRFTHDSTQNNSISDNRALAIAEDRNHTLWIGTWGGINRYNSKTNTFERFLPDSENLISEHTWTIYLDNNRELWIGTVGGGLVRFNPKTKKFERHLYNHGNLMDQYLSDISAIREDRDGNFWIGTLSSGLFLYNRQDRTFVNYSNDPTQSNSLGNNTVQDIYEDDSGTLWIATWGGGVTRINQSGQKFKHYLISDRSADLMEVNNISSFHEDISGNLWVGTNHGLYQLDPTRQISKVYKPTDRDYPLSNNIINCLIRDTDTTLWIGASKGLNLFNLKTGKTKRYGLINGLSHSEIQSLLVDSKGTLWVGTRSGLNQLMDDGSFVHLIKTDNILSLFQSRDQTLWIGTWDGLKEKIPDNKEIFTHSHIPHDTTSISSNYINLVFQDSKDRIWIGTQKGLNQYNRKKKTFRRYFQRDGLASDVINGILEDSNGLIWISTNNGISTFNPETASFRNYDADDGLQGNQFKVGACFKSPDGEMFFGGVNGYNAFYPSSISDNQYIPPVVLTDFKLFYKSVDFFDEDAPLQKHISETQSIVLSYQDRVLSIEFAALNYSNSDKNQYMYKLDGFDKDWVLAGTRRSAPYTNLDPGSYTFMVKGSNNDGVWNEQSKKLKIIIKPPFWETPLFRITVLISIVIILTLFYKLRTRTLKKQRRTLQTLVQERTTELVEQKEQLFEKKQALAQSELEKEQLANQKLQMELETRSAELSSYTLHIVQKNKMLDIIKSKIVELKKVSDGQLSRQYQELVRLIDKNLNLEKDWEDFQIIFESVHKNYFPTMKARYPQLTTNDLRICALLRLNLNTKEIATIMGVSPHSIKIARYRIRKKLKLKPEENLNDFIMKL